MKNFLLDKDFLRELDQYPHKEIYAKITVLNFGERPLEQIEGRITGGSLNIDGSSAVRRTCNLTLVAKELNINEFYWSIANKFKLEIGVKNFINPNYPDIIWFNKGIFCITAFNTSYSTSNYQVSISGQDKMCMLNGTLGGSLYASIDFGQLETYNTIYEEVIFTEEDYLNFEAGKYYIYNPDYVPQQNMQEYIPATKEYSQSDRYYKRLDTSSLESFPIKYIIREAVHTYANEPYHNIIINDLEEYGLELLEYRGDRPLYFFFNANICENMTYNEDMWFINENWAYAKQLKELGKDSQGNSIPNNEIDNLVEGFREDTLKLQMITIKKDENNQELYHPNGRPVVDQILDTKYTVAKVEYGQTAGYRQTDLIYPGELISSIGETLTSILDKIKNMFGDFEYFYDIDGRFVFQKKKTYVNTTWNTLVETNDKDMYAENAAYTSDVQYSFEDNNLVISFSNNPQLTNLKNDFSVWGVRKGITGQDIPIHARYAIDKKPFFYRSFDDKFYIADASYAEGIDKTTIKTIVKRLIRERIINFQPRHGVYKDLLQKPEKQDDYSWSPGWWDIRDWCEFYSILTLEQPIYTMKWYSRNDEKGCVDISSLPSELPQKSNYNPNGQCWLIIIENPFTEKELINLQHGSGVFSSTKISCTKYYSYYMPNGDLRTETVTPTEKKNFSYPYAGCSNNHTYLSFLKDDVDTKGNLVYFYNPNFPDVNSFETFLEQQEDKQVDIFLDSEYVKVVDWREIIYQMALDYFKHGQEDDFLIRVKNNNYFDDDFLFPDGYTGYEQYYTDLEGFWRQLYNINPTVTRENIGGRYEEVRVDLEDEEGSYKMEMQWVDFVEDLTDFSCDYYLPTSYKSQSYYKCSSENAKKHFNNELQYWNKNAILAPETLNFWFEFLDVVGGELEQFSVPYIGDRAKSINDSNVSAIYFRETPNIIFARSKTGSVCPICQKEWDKCNCSGYFDPMEINTGYVYIMLQPYIENSFVISAQGKSAKDRIDELLYNHTYCMENITLSTIPVYYLEPNARIYVHDEDSKINGDYIVSKLSIPLTYNGTMSINATKAVERLL